MALGTRIEWTEATWNPVTGCTKVSAGCKNCYAERLAWRLKAMGMNKYRNGFRVTLHPAVLRQPFRWRSPRTVFVNSMSDLFHKKVPEDFVRQVFDTMERLPRHTFQVLTKRPELALELAPRLPWPKNIWFGVTVENAECVDRVRILRRIPAKVRFLSCEPLLGPLPRLPLKGIHWVIVGGESGPGARPMAPEWVLQIRNRCITAGVPFFFKQWGGVNKKKTGRLVEGRTWDDRPAADQGEVERYAEAATA